MGWACAAVLLSALLFWAAVGLRCACGCLCRTRCCDSALRCPHMRSLLRCRSLLRPLLRSAAVLGSHDPSGGEDSPLLSFSSSRLLLRGPQPQDLRRPNTPLGLGRGGPPLHGPNPGKPGRGKGKQRAPGPRLGRGRGSGRLRRFHAFCVVFRPRISGVFIRFHAFCGLGFQAFCGVLRRFYSFCVVFIRFASFLFVLRRFAASVFLAFPASADLRFRHPTLGVRGRHRFRAQPQACARKDPTCGNP